MKQARYLLLLCISVFILDLAAYQNSFLNLLSPTQLGDLETEVGFSHRFRGKIDDEPLDTFFGLERGAGVGLFYRQALVHGAELKLGYLFDDREYNINANWTFTPVDFPVQAMADVQYFTFEEYDFASNDMVRRKNVLLSVAAQNKPLLDRYFLNANLGYEAENERLVTGFGLGVIALPNLTVLGEYYPVWDRDSASDEVQAKLKEHDSYVLGLKLDTYGHHFMFTLGNSDAMSLRKLSMGSPDRALRLGFNIQRKMDFLRR